MYGFGTVLSAFGIQVEAGLGVTKSPPEWQKSSHVGSLFRAHDTVIALEQVAVN